MRTRDHVEGLPPVNGDPGSPAGGATIDSDPVETQEWLDALDAVVRVSGHERALALLRPHASVPTSKARMKTLLLAAVLALALPAAAQSPWKIDRAKSSIRFVITQMNVPVEGQFKRFDATVAFDPAKPEATKAEFEVDTASIDLGSAEGDTEAKTKPWLNVALFPKATFVADSVKASGPGKFVATGKLTIKGISLPITAPFTFAQGAGTRTVDGQFPIKRLAFKVGEGSWSDTDTVADEVVVRFRFTIPTNP